MYNAGLREGRTYKGHIRLREVGISTLRAGQRPLAGITQVLHVGLGCQSAQQLTEQRANPQTHQRAQSCFLFLAFGECASQHNNKRERERERERETLLPQLKQLTQLKATPQTKHTRERSHIFFLAFGETKECDATCSGHDACLERERDLFLCCVTAVSRPPSINLSLSLSLSLCLPLPLSTSLHYLLQGPSLCLSLCLPLPLPCCRCVRQNLLCGEGGAVPGT